MNFLIKRTNKELTYLSGGYALKDRIEKDGYLLNIYRHTTEGYMMEICDSARVVINTVKTTYYKDLINMIKTDFGTLITPAKPAKRKQTQAQIMAKLEHFFNGKMPMCEKVENGYVVGLANHPSQFDLTEGEYAFRSVACFLDDILDEVICKQYRGYTITHVGRFVTVYNEAGHIFKRFYDMESREALEWLIDWYCAGNLHEEKFDPVEVIINEEVYHPDLGEAVGSQHDNIFCESWDDLMWVFSNYYPYYTSSSHYDKGTWFITDSTPNYRTGERTQYSLHFDRAFSKAEFEDIRAEFALSCEWSK